LKFEWPNAAIRPKWNAEGDVIACQLLLNPKDELAIFFTGNGISFCLEIHDCIKPKGSQIPINHPPYKL
jgi:hypothetical protein